MQREEFQNKGEQFYVVTGGPGSGKSSLIEALHRSGYARTIEGGRGVIQDQVRIEGPGLPWRDRLLFAELMLCWDMRSYHIALKTAGPVFFDRGIPDVLGYLRLVDIPAPQHMRKSAEMFRYNPTVFIAPPWRDIFRQDRERKQDFDEAIRTYDSMVSTYLSLDYSVVEIPRTSIEERVRFVLRSIGK